MSITEPKAAGFVTRRAAGLEPPRSVSRNITPSRGGVAIHYGGANVPTSGPASAVSMWRSWQRHHMVNNGWVDIAYTMGVDNWGFVYAGRGAGVRTAANGTNSGNQNYYAVAWIGGASQRPTRAALSAIAWAVQELRRSGAGLAVKPHSLFTGTACPGDPLRAEIRAIDGSAFRPPAPPPEPAPEPLPPSPSVDRNSAEWVGPQSIGIVRTSQWHLNKVPSGGSAFKTFFFGTTGDIPLTGRTDGVPFNAIVRDNTWYIKYGLMGGNAEISFRFGRKGDVFLLGDWRGDGNYTPGIFRDGEWHIKYSLSGGDADESFRYGREGDIPVVGDWACAGRDTIGIVRGSEWHLKNSLGGGAADITFHFGRAGDLPITGKWASGKSGIGIIRNGYWYLRKTATGGPAESIFRFGRVDAGDKPVVGFW